MRIFFVFFLISTLASLPSHARENVIKFDGVQEHCVQVGKIKFGANAKWPDCNVTKGRWFVTLDYIDMYQAQYCLGKGKGGCEQRALLVFANRAYKPHAQLMLQRIDPGAVEYDDPLVVQTKYGDILTLSARFPDGHEDKSYFRWNSGRWIPVNARGWLRDLSMQLPRGETIRGTLWPDADSMSSQATIHIAGSSRAEDRVAKVDLGLAHDRFSVMKVTLVQKTD